MRAVIGRSILVVVSTLLSASVGIGLYHSLTDQAKAPTPTSDFTLALTDALGRPLSAQPGPLRLELAPFTLYTNAPSQQTDSYTIDENGFRGGLGSPGLPKVFLLGGSTAFGQDIKGDDQTITGHLRTLAPSHAFINAGVVGYVSGQELAHLVHHLDPFQPAGYILVDGWNELFDQWFYWPRPPHRLGFNNTFFDIENRLHHFHVEHTKTTPLPPFVPALTEKTLDEIAASYFANVERMHIFARARGAFFLWVVQPELGSKPRPTPKEAEALAAWNAAYGYLDRDFSNQYQRLAKSALAFARLHQIPCLVVQEQADWRNPNADYFLDPVHLTPAGARALAQAIHDQVKSRSWLANTNSQLRSN